MGWKAFVEGGAASVVAGSVTHPLDLIKVRMQLQVEPPPMAMAFAGGSGGAAAAIGGGSAGGPIAMGIRVVQSEGAAALFSGVSASVLRQCLYSTTRLGLYDAIKRQRESSHEGVMPVSEKLAAGLFSGAAGAAVGCPADVALVRMQADGRLPAAQRRNYAGVGDALATIVRREGVPALWRGSAPTVQRAMVVTAAQLASYDTAKETLLSNGAPDGMSTHVAASFAAGMVASVASNPIDVVKTRIMNMPSPAPGERPFYSGAMDCAIKTVRSEGAMALYKGFVPTVSRQGPFAVVLFVTLEQVRSLLKNV